MSSEGLKSPIPDGVNSTSVEANHLGGIVPTTTSENTDSNTGGKKDSAVNIGVQRIFTPYIGVRIEKVSQGGSDSGIGSGSGSGSDSVKGVVLGSASGKRRDCSVV